MKIELKSLDLVHFKCFPKLHLDFHEGVNNIYGENAAGKTSVYDALTWLLFNKDSAGNARPDIKPHHAPAGTMPEVTAILEVDGEPIKLRKVLREKWEKPRGSSIERYAGDTRDYYIDDVPLAENAYKRRIAELIDERQFKLLTDVWAVTKEMHWKDRRTLLAEICGLPEDKQLLAAAPQFTELNEKVGRRTVDEYKSVLMQQRKDTLLEDSKFVKRGIAAAKDRLLTAETALKTAQDEVQKAQISLDSYTPPVEVVPENLPDYDRRKGAILTLIADADKRIDRLTSDTEQERRRLETALSAVTAEKLRHDAVLAKEQTLSDTRRRIADLQAEQRKAAAEVEQMDRLIAMCEEFTRYRVQAITESVNSKFRLTRWRLFTEQVNGGLADCCEPMDRNGSTFEGTNNAMQINIGMDIIDTLSAHFGRRVPLFVDNAESVTHLQSIGSQVVRLVVSEQDKELRIE